MPGRQTRGPAHNNARQPITKTLPYKLHHNAGKSPTAVSCCMCVCSPLSGSSVRAADCLAWSSASTAVGAGSCALLVDTDAMILHMQHHTDTPHQISTAPQLSTKRFHISATAMTSLVLCLLVHERPLVQVARLGVCLVCRCCHLGPSSCLLLLRWPLSLSSGSFYRRRWWRLRFLVSVHGAPAIGGRSVGRDA